MAVVPWLGDRLIVVSSSRSPARYAVSDAGGPRRARIRNRISTLGP